jgi:hypothetical protein
VTASTVPGLGLAGVLLVAGWATFWMGAFTPPWRWWFSIPVREYLELVGAHRGVWLWVHGCFAAGVVMTLAGLIVLRTILREAGDRFASELGQGAFLLGCILWLSDLTFRATATLSAATETISRQAVPSWFEPLRSWMGAFFAIYMVLAYLAIAAYGKALLTTTIVPRWLGWTHVVFGLAGAAGYLARVPIFDPPLMIHLVPGILGISLLRRG